MRLRLGGWLGGYLSSSGVKCCGPRSCRRVRGSCAQGYGVDRHSWSSSISHGKFASSCRGQEGSVKPICHTTRYRVATSLPCKAPRISSMPSSYSTHPSNQSFHQQIYQWSGSASTSSQKGQATALRHVQGPSTADSKQKKQTAECRL